MWLPAESGDAKADEREVGTRDVGGRTPTCPFCGAADAELLSLFGSQLLTEQFYCRACHTPFEHVKDDDVAATESP